MYEGVLVGASGAGVSPKAGVMKQTTGTCVLSWLAWAAGSENCGGIVVDDGDGDAASDVKGFAGA